MGVNDRSFRMRGRDVVLHEVPDLAALPPSQAGDAPPMSARALEGIALHVAAPQVRAFESAGWAFVPRADAAGGAKVYVRPGGQVALGTNRLTVRVKGDRTEEQAREFLAEHGMTVVDHLKFASNLFVVEAGAGQDAIDAARALDATGNVEFAEPELIEAYSMR